jgi:hypothetical protein
VRIGTLNVNIHTPHDTVALMSAVLAAGASALIANKDRASAAQGQARAPAIGEIWPGQGGIYVGLSRGEEGQPDAHLIVHVAEAEDTLDWEGAKAWAAAITVDGLLTDFHLPTRSESALLYANVRDLMDKDGWYWTSTQYAGYESYAWYQSFGLGGQSSYRKSYEGRVRAVRRLTA